MPSGTPRRCATDARQHRRLLQALRQVRERLLPRVLRRGQARSRRAGAPGFHRVSALRGGAKDDAALAKARTNGMSLKVHSFSVFWRSLDAARAMPDPLSDLAALVGQYGDLGKGQAGGGRRRRAVRRRVQRSGRSKRSSTASRSAAPTEATRATPRFASRPSPTIRVPCGRRGVRTSTRIGTAPTSRGRRWRTFRGTGAAGTRWWSAGWRATYRGAGPPRG